MERKLNERDLLEALRRRDPDALSALFERYADRIYRLAAGLLHDDDEADSVVQDTFMALITQADSFEGRSSIGTWLYRVAYNACMMRLRRARPHVELDADEDGDTMPAAFIDWRDLPEDIVASSEARAQMEQAIAALKPELRAVFILRDVEELSTRETAEALGITEGLVKVRLHRARLALREQLALYFEDYAQA